MSVPTQLGRQIAALGRLGPLRCSSSVAPNPSWSSLALVRDYIHDSLYSPVHGYFTRQAPVGFLPEGIDFGGLAGQTAYLAAVQQRYRDLQVAWMTPAEIFSPHYGAAFARYLALQHTQGDQPAGGGSSGAEPLHVHEIGGGTGTFAKDVLGWLRAHRPELYGSCRYTSVEISPVLAQVQMQRVAEEAGHSGRFNVQVGDAAEATTWGGHSPEPCFVIMMEVLDNLPHDRVWREGPGGAWHQTYIARSPAASTKESEDFAGERSRVIVGTECLEEVVAPVEDALIHRCLDAWGRLGQGGSAVGGVRGGLLSLLHHFVNAGAGDAAFLPTGALQLFDTLHAVRPRHRLVAADFDELPGTSVDGWNAPLVATTRGGGTRDHGTYLVQPGSADIFFPSDFALLRELYVQAAGRRDAALVHTMKSRRFLELFAPDAGAAAAAKDGYNPLLQDYSNTAVLLS